ncbi:hypothetical protein B0J11DRAFT_579220 [Dendryphion nanum]|uniref:Uncharacterized protein n=1 Tax=Dendryphion nanum TaxID=256645 RepID=A0A9P9DX16_9PLEO|nr:hypothetical protein B0J11DRAFT_579220 [Dendryphion nanum]
MGDASDQKGKDLKCNQCDTTVGVVSSTGILVLASSTRTCCGACRLFEELYDNVQKADEAFENLKSRRRNVRARQNAFDDQRSAHKALGNFLQQLDQVIPKVTSIVINNPGGPTPNKDSSNAGPSREPDNVDLNKEQEQRDTTTESVKKRLLEQVVNSDSENQATNKRRQMAKRVSFDATTVQHEVYRRTDEYRRGGGAYVPGPHAASEGSELLDTSGQNQKFGVYHQMTWDRRRRVWTSDIIQEDEFQDEDMNDTQEQRRLITDVSEKAPGESNGNKIDEDNETPAEDAVMNNVDHSSQEAIRNARSRRLAIRNQLVETAMSETEREKI